MDQKNSLGAEVNLCPLEDQKGEGLDLGLAAVPKVPVPPPVPDLQVDLKVAPEVVPKAVVREADPELAREHPEARVFH